MSVIQCSASGCGSTEKSGKIFYQCSKCGRDWRSSHGHEGKKCICGGYMHKV